MRLRSVLSTLVMAACIMFGAAQVAQATEVDTHKCTGPNDCGPSTSCGPVLGACAHSSPNGDCDIGEECDDGNTLNGDGCDNNCTLTRCGNGVSSTGEECDNGAANDCVQPSLGGNACDTSCKLKACGNGRVECDEQCDDGDTFNLDDCDSGAPGPKGTCLLPTCGNGITDSPREVCDDGNTLNGDGCDNNCTVTACGNGVKAGAEQCDDGNTVNGDGCEGNCALPKCGDGLTDNGETCDDGNTVACDGCSATCKTEVCGNGTKECTEACDDGNTVNADGCEGNCTLPKCGNGITDPGESCDDGNTVSEVGGCPSTCKAACGDGITEAGEQCDSGACVCDAFPTKFSFGRDCGTVDGRDDCQIDAGTCVNGLKGGGFPACSFFINHVLDTCVVCGVVAGDGNSDYTPDACRDNCKTARCGDAVTDTGEGCDDGLINAAGPEPGDDIDKCPNGPAATALNLACKMANVCGDAFTKFPSETDPNCQGPLCALSVPDTQACDNGGGVIQTVSGPVPAAKTCAGDPTKTCADDVDCVDPQGTTGPCGNGNSGGVCTPGGPYPNTEPGQCRCDCTPPRCGDGITDPNEGCDDGNTVDDPICLGNCSLPGCGDGMKIAPETCDNGAANNGVNNPCTDTCKVATCGDGKACNTSGCTTGPSGAPEQCDDGNLNNFDSCKNNCSANVCGDGVTLSSGAGPFEQCDDGNTASLDGCSAGCCFEPGANVPGGIQGLFSGQQCDLSNLAMDVSVLARSTVVDPTTMPPGVVKTLTNRLHTIRKVVSQAQSSSINFRQVGKAQSRKKLCRLEKHAEHLLVGLQRTLDKAFLNRQISYAQYADSSSHRVDAVGFADQIRQMSFCK